MQRVMGSEACNRNKVSIQKRKKKRAAMANWEGRSGRLGERWRTYRCIWADGLWTRAGCDTARDKPVVRLLPVAMSRSGCDAMRKTKEGSGLSAHRKGEGRTTAKDVA